MPDNQQIRLTKLIPKILSQTLFFALMLFLPAFTLRWWQGWVFLLLSLVVGLVGTLWLNRSNPGLLRERLKPIIQADQPKSDKRATLLFAAAAWLWFAFIPLDVFHLHCLPLPPAWLRWTGLALWAVSIWLIYLTFRANSFAAPVVKLQAERQQIVIDTGPYALVRHPLYSAALVYAIGIALWLGSLAAIPLLVLPLAGLVLRIRAEEAYLKQNLPGYEAYLRSHPWRIVPYLW